MGAQTKLTADVHLVIVEAIEKGLPWCHAAAMAEVDVGTLKDWREKGAKENDGIYHLLYLDIKRARAERIQSRLALIDAAADDGNWTAAAWELERSDPDNFSLKQKHEITGGPGEPLEVKIIYNEKETEDKTDD